MRISQITRRDIADAITVEGVNWNGRLEESEFLVRIFDLNSLPSTDGRFKDAAGDIWQHRVNNPEDWSDDWIFRDERFNLMGQYGTGHGQSSKAKGLTSRHAKLAVGSASTLAVFLSETHQAKK